MKAIDPQASKLTSYDEAWEIIAEYGGLIGDLKTKSVRQGPTTTFTLYKENGSTKYLKKSVFIDPETEVLLVNSEFKNINSNIDSNTNGYKIVTKEQILEKVNNALKTIGKAYESSQDEGEEDDMVMFILARENIGIVYEALLRYAFWLQFGEEAK